MISIKFKDNKKFDKTEKYLKKFLAIQPVDNANILAIRMVEALKEATPVDTGMTKNSWGYTINKEENKTTITLTNSNVKDGCNVAILLEYGHGNKYGTWVEGKNYIEPALAKLYMDAVNKTWEEYENL